MNVVGNEMKQGAFREATNRVLSVEMFFYQDNYVGFAKFALTIFESSVLIKS